MLKRCFFFWGLLCGASHGVWAHGDLHEQIQLVSSKIREAPNDLALYLERGQLYFEHEEWDKALADFEIAELDAAAIDVVDRLRAKTGLAGGLYHYGLVCVERCIKRSPDDPAGWLIRARLLVKLNAPIEAAESYTKAIERMQHPAPDCYIERARAWRAAGVDYIQQAIDGLDEGLHTLGELVALQEAALDLALEAQRFDDALARVNKILEQTPRKETWLVRKADVLDKEGKTSEARQVYAEADVALRRLPENLRNAPAMRALAEKIDLKIKGL